MTEQVPPWLEQLLAGARLDFPPAPSLEAAVLARVGGAQGRPRRAPAFALAAVLVLAMAVTAALAVPGTRGGLAGFLGLRVPGEVIDVLPTPAGDASPTALPSPPALESIAERVTLQEAAAAAGFEPALPAGLEPEAVYTLGYRGFPVVVLRFAGFDLWQAVPGGFVGKGIVLDGTLITEAQVGDHPAYWLQGGPRLVTFHAPDGTEIAGSQRTVLANTLVWATETRYYRLEGDLGMEAAIAIAVTLP